MRALLAAALALAMGSVHAAVPRPVTREVYLMGTRATLATFDGDRAVGLQRLERLLRALELTEAQLSTWRQDSEISRLNARAGSGPVRLSGPLCAQFAALERAVDETDGTFDPAIGALTAAWDVHGTGRLPTASALRDARDHSGWMRVAFDSNACRLTLPSGMSFDVGGFGKGEALDRARDSVSGDGAAWLIDLGGQLAAQGAPPDQAGWAVSVAHPLRRHEPALRLTMASGSLATSAGSERDLVVAGRRVGHILDPRTGRPAPFTGSVSVWHEQGLVADVLSTALYVMGPEVGLRWADARGIAACYLRPDGPAAVPRPSRAFVAKFGLR